MTDPPLIGITAWCVARIRGARLIHWVQDIYPEIAVAVTRQQWLRLFTPLRNAAWRGADSCVALSAEMADVVAEAGVSRSRIAIIGNWAPQGLGPISPEDTAVKSLRREWGLEGKCIVAYSGNLGRVHDLDPVIDAAGHLSDAAHIVILFIGGGAQRRALEAAAAQRKLTNVRFLPSQPREQLRAVLGVADLHLVTLRPGCEPYVFPSKLYGVAAVGRPVLFIGPTTCELASLVKKHAIGEIIARNDSRAIASLIAELASKPALLAQYGQRAAEFANTRHTQLAIDRWRDILASVGV